MHLIIRIVPQARFSSWSRVEIKFRRSTIGWKLKSVPGLSRLGRKSDSDQESNLGPDFTNSGSVLWVPEYFLIKIVEHAITDFNSEQNYFFSGKKKKILYHRMIEKQNKKKKLLITNHGNTNASLLCARIINRYYVTQFTNRETLRSDANSSIKLQAFNYHL